MQKKKRQKDTKEIIRSRRANETPEKKLRFKLKGEADRRNRKAAEISGGTKDSTRPKLSIFEGKTSSKTSGKSSSKTIRKCRE